jgi:hypothetical protein
MAPDLRGCEQSKEKTQCFFSTQLIDGFEPMREQDEYSRT